MKIPSCGDGRLFKMGLFSRGTVQPFQSLYELKKQLAKLQDSFAARNDLIDWQSEPSKEDHLSITAKRLFPNGAFRFMEVPLYYPAKTWIGQVASKSEQ